MRSNFCWGVLTSPQHLFYDQDLGDVRVYLRNYLIGLKIRHKPSHRVFVNILEDLLSFFGRDFLDPGASQGVNLDNSLFRYLSTLWQDSSCIIFLL
jgi:hypothetical protein